MRLSPRHPEARYYLGATLRQLARVDEAMAKLLEFPKHVTVLQDHLDQLFPVRGFAAPAAETGQSASPQSCNGSTEPADSSAIDPALPPGYVDMRTAADADDPHAAMETGAAPLHQPA